MIHGFGCDAQFTNQENKEKGVFYFPET